MAKADHYSAALRNLMLDELDALDDGYYRIYSGTQPANVAASLTGTLLAELRYNATGFAAASAGSKTADAMVEDSSANATGTATHTRSFASNGSTAHVDGNVGTSDENLILNTTSIVTAAAVSVTSLVATMAA